MNGPYIYRLTRKTMRYIDEDGRLRVRPRSEAPVDPYRNQPVRRRRLSEAQAEAEIRRLEGDQP